MSKALHRGQTKETNCSQAERIQNQYTVKYSGRNILARQNAVYLHCMAFMIRVCIGVLSLSQRTHSIQNLHYDPRFAMKVKVANFFVTLKFADRLYSFSHTVYRWASMTSTTPRPLYNATQLTREVSIRDGWTRFKPILRWPPRVGMHHSIGIN